MAQYDFTVRAVDETGAFADRTFNIEVQNNLVDQMAYNDGTDIYSSIDGINWTKRVDKGSRSGTLYYENGYWVLFDGYSSIKRLSRDCINWQDVGQINITNLDSSFEGKYNDVRFNYYAMTTIAGWTYIPCTKINDPIWGNLFSNNDNALVRTKDFTNFELVGYNSNTYNQIVDNAGQIIGRFIDGSIIESNTASNIISYNGYYLMIADKKVLRSSDLNIWEELTSISNMSYARSINKLININGVIVIMCNHTELNTGNPYQQCLYSTDLYNWTVSYDTVANNIDSEPHTGEIGFNYINGMFIAFAQDNSTLASGSLYNETYYANFQYSTDLLNWYPSGYLSGNWGGTAVIAGGVFQGKMAVVSHYDSKLEWYTFHTDENSLVKVGDVTLPSIPVGGRIAFIK